MRYRDYVEQRILRPLGMTSTRWEASAVPAGHLAKGYQWKDGAWMEEPPLADGSFGAMGGLITTGRDLARYVAFLLSAWPAARRPGHGSRAAQLACARCSRADGSRACPRLAPRPTRPLRVTATTYGFGIAFSQDCDTRSSCPTAAGCPGSDRSCAASPSRAWPCS